MNPETITTLAKRCFTIAAEHDSGCVCATGEPFGTSVLITIEREDDMELELIFESTDVSDERIAAEVEAEIAGWAGAASDCYAAARSERAQMGIGG